MLTVKISILLVSLLVWIGLIVILRRWAKSQQRLAYGPPRCWGCLYEIDSAVGAERCSECGADLRVAQSEMAKYERFRLARRWWSALANLAFLVGGVCMGMFKYVVDRQGRPPLEPTPVWLAALSTVVFMLALFFMFGISVRAWLPKIKEPRDNR